MISVSIDRLADSSGVIQAELRAGHSLRLLDDGKSIAEIVPTPVPPTGSGEDFSSFLHVWASEEERLTELEQAVARMRRGYDLGGFKITDRDALYDRD